MNPQLNYILAQEHIADLHRAAQRARLATESATDRRNSPEGNPTTRRGARLPRLAPSRP